MFGFHISFYKKIKPTGGFIEYIIINGNKVTVKIRGRKTLYHYQPNDTIVTTLKKEKYYNLGTFYNKYLKGTSVAKTVFEKQNEQ